ncbi:MAG: hypothetical protein Q4C61_05900 [Lachnospiraceae bacterium]|nr:hypothetical protein [Lachnospiraceae bacterium]
MIHAYDEMYVEGAMLITGSSIRRQYGEKNAAIFIGVGVSLKTALALTKALGVKIDELPI